MFLWKEAFGCIMLSRQSFAIPATLQRSYTTLYHAWFQLPETLYLPDAWLQRWYLGKWVLKNHLHIQLLPRYGKIRAIRPQPLQLRAQKFTPDKIPRETRADGHKLPSFTRKLSAVGTCWERGKSVFFNGVTAVHQPHSRAGPMSRSTD